MAITRPLSVVLLAALAGACGGSQPAQATLPEFPPPAAGLQAYCREVSARFDEARALRTVAFVDQFFRVRGNAGYQASLTRVQEDLVEGGFDAAQIRRLELGGVEPTWTPQSAHVVLVGADGERTPLVSFDDESGHDRAMLLVGSSRMNDWSTEIVRIERVRQGESAVGRLVLAEGSPTDVYREAVELRGASGILIRNLESYHTPDVHPDSAQFGYLPRTGDTSAVGFSLSDRAWRLARAATERGPARVQVDVAVEVGSSAASAIEARIVGTQSELGAIVFSTHVDEPGANDNASGVGALVELAVALRSGIDAGAIPAPRRTLVFLWGQEIEASGAWLDQNRVPVAAGLVMDMVGEDPSAVGAPFRIERMPDPGAVWLRDPDGHSEWGQGEVSEDSLRGHFLNDVLRAAMAAVDEGDPHAWETIAHPFEGGSDHVSFLQRGLPAVLAWHFTDDAYHTTLDRLPRVSGAEMRRVAATLGGAALAMSSARTQDLEEFVTIVHSAARQRLRWAADAARVRVAAGEAREAEAHVLAAWARWYDQALESVVTWEQEASPRVERAASAARQDVAQLALTLAAEL